MAAACEKQNNPCYSPKSLFVPKTSQNSGHICCHVPCQEIVLQPPLWSDFTPHSFLLGFLFDFVSNYRTTHNSWWVEKITLEQQWLITEISRAWYERLCLRLPPPGHGDNTYKLRACHSRHGLRKSSRRNLLESQQNLEWNDGVLNQFCYFQILTFLNGAQGRIIS